MSDIIATGRRKTSIAQIRLREGSGSFKINGKEFTDYFPSLSMQNTILRPLEIANAVHRCGSKDLGRWNCRTGRSAAPGH
jgi:small subunit ribosomal protein S9